MSSRTPPLPALRAFAALVRLGSINAVAQELSLTPGAVGHQIRSLEKHLDLPLIERHGRRLALTQEGRIYGYQIRQALDDIAQATQSAKKRQIPSAQASLKLSVLPSFANGWLIARLPAFCRKYPQTRLMIHGSMEFVELQEGRFDCAIRFGHGQWADALLRPLMSDQLVLLASPTLLGAGSPKKLSEILKHPVLHASENWSAWLSGIPESERQNVSRPVTCMAFSDSTHLLEAARCGLGVALTRRSIADQLLAQGKLVIAHPHVCPHTSAYYALTPLGAKPRPELNLFLSWLQNECEQFSIRERMPPLLSQ